MKKSRVFCALALFAAAASADLAAFDTATPVNACMALPPAPNNGTYVRTPYSVSVYTEAGQSKGAYAICLRSGMKYINFKNTWVCIQGKNRFFYGGNWYIIK